MCPLQLEFNFWNPCMAFESVDEHLDSKIEVLFDPSAIPLILGSNELFSYCSELKSSCLQAHFRYAIFLSRCTFKLNSSGPNEKKTPRFKSRNVSPHTNTALSALTLENWWKLRSVFSGLLIEIDSSPPSSVIFFSYDIFFQLGL